MRVVCATAGNRGLTLLEALVVLFSLFILAVTLLASASAPRLRTAMGCVRQLKQTGQAFQVWAGDHRGQYPMSISVSNGGARELALQGNAPGVFQVLSNEFRSSRILVCPADPACRPAAGFKLAAANISYFVNVDSPVTSWALLAGDDNLTLRGRRVPAGRLEIPSNHPVAWFPNRHKWYGNVVLADGRVTSLGNSNLVQTLRSGANSLAVP